MSKPTRSNNKNFLRKSVTINIYLLYTFLLNIKKLLPKLQIGYCKEIQTLFVTAKRAGEFCICLATTKSWFVSQAYLIFWVVREWKKKFMYLEYHGLPWCKFHGPQFGKHCSGSQVTIRSRNGLLMESRAGWTHVLIVAGDCRVESTELSRILSCPWLVPSMCLTWYHAIKTVPAYQLMKSPRYNTLCYYKFWVCAEGGCSCIVTWLKTSALPWKYSADLILHSFICLNFIDTTSG